VRLLEERASFGATFPLGALVLSRGLNFTINRNGSNTVARVSMGYPGLETLFPWGTLVMGLEHWDQRSGAFRLIEEPRLSRLLRLRLQDDNRLATTGDPQLRTPRWMFATLAGHRPDRPLSKRVPEIADDIVSVSRWGRTAKKVQPISVAHRHGAN
jgi:hypothetical protein